MSKKLSHEEFQARVALVRRQRPGHPLLGQLNSHTSIAEMYLRHALRGLEVQEARTQVPSTDQDPDTPEWDQLQMKKGRLYGRRANLSNQFHKHPDDVVACANLSDEIRIVQRAIAKVQRQIAHYRRTGELLEEAPPTERQYQDVELHRAERSAYEGMRRWRKRIEREGAHQDARTRAEWDKKLKEYERKHTELKGQIRQATV